jgi:hypothetical protein
MQSNGNQRSGLSQWVSSCGPRDNLGPYHSAFEAFQSANKFQLALLDSEDVQTTLLANKQHILGDTSCFISGHAQCIKSAEVASLAWRNTLADHVVETQIKTGQAVEVCLRLVRQWWIRDKVLRRWASSLVRVHGRSTVSSRGIAGRV